MRVLSDPMNTAQSIRLKCTYSMRIYCHKHNFLS